MPDGIFRAAVSTLALALCMVVDVGAATIHVAMGGSIQAAIDAASPGDTVYLGPGEYFENIRVKQGVALVGSGAQATTIRALLRGCVVLADGDNELRHLTIADGDPGVYASNGGDFIASDCSFIGNNSTAVVTLLGRVPMEQYTTFWISHNEVSHLDRPWSNPYPSKTTLNDIPFLALGARPAASYAERYSADWIYVLPLGEAYEVCLYPDDKGVWRKLSDGEPASYELIEVYPWKGFVYSMADIDKLEDRRFYVAKRPYSPAD